MEIITGAMTALITPFKNGKVDLEKYAKEEQRWFIDELLLDVWLETKKYKYKEINVDFFEKQNWLKKGGLFIKRKIMGK